MITIRTLIVGTGSYGLRLAGWARHVPGLHIEKCYHPDLQKCKDAALKMNCNAAFSEEEAFRNIEAVIIATPDLAHSHYVQLAIDAGCHIFVEKPMVGCLEQAIELRTALEDYPGVFCVGHNIRREPGFRFLKQQFDDGLLGELVSFHISLSHGGAYNWSKDYWRNQAELCREGPLRVNGVHASDTLEYLFGDISSVYAKIGTRITERSAPDSGIALVEVDGVFGTIDTHWVVPSLNRFQFQFSNAVAEYDLKELRIRYGRDIECQPTSEKIIQLPEINSRIDQFDVFYNAIANNTAVETGFEQGFRAVLFYEACYRSFENNHICKLVDLLK